MRFLLVLPIFVFLTGGCGAQQERINAAQQEYDAASARVDQLSRANNECIEAIFAASEKKQIPSCDMAKIDDERTQAFNAQKAAYANLEAIPGHPMLMPPMDMQAFEKGIDRRLLQEGSYASDCDRGQASACIQYQQALQQDRDREMQEHEDFERSMENLMTAP
jgi:hypothetical protein